MTQTNSRMVFSTDATQNKKCPHCGELPAGCRCKTPQAVDPKSVTAVLRIEKGGRGGKTVTVVAKLPRSESFLRDLASELKAKCGAGGTFAVKDGEGVVEIQGDKRDAIRAALTKKGMKVKG